MAVLITGVGLVGANVCRRFIEEGYDVICYDLVDRKIDFLEKASGKFTFVKGDILDLESLKEVVKRHEVEGVVHTVIYATSSDAQNMFKVNVAGTSNILEVARLNGLRVVNVSSGAVYGHRPDLKPLKEDDSRTATIPPDAPPAVLYTYTKRMAEELVEMYHATFGVDTVTVRASYVYGPADSAARHLQRGPPLLVRKALMHEPLKMTQGGDEMIDCTYAADLANGIHLAYSVRPIQQRTFNISAGRLTKMSEVARAVKKAVEGAEIELGPGPWPEVASAFARGPFDITRARQELGYVPRYSIEDAIREYVDWYRKNANWM